DGAAAHAAHLFRIGHDRLDFLDAAQYRAERDELAAGHARDDPRQRRLAYARRSPENHGTEGVALDLLAQRLAGPEDVLLAHIVVERPGPHALRQRALLIRPRV